MPDPGGGVVVVVPFIVPVLVLVFWSIVCGSEHAETGGVGIEVSYEDAVKVFTPEQIVACMLTKVGGWVGWYLWCACGRQNIYRNVDVSSAICTFSGVLSIHVYVHKVKL